jgi:hypothetical protein
MSGVGILSFALVLAILFPVEPVAAQVRFVERDGTLYVTNVASSVTAPGAGNVGVGEYAALIEDVAARYAMPARLIEFVIHTESNFNPRAVSPRGARGLTQLMPARAALLGVRDVFDARENIDVGVRYLRGLIDQYSGDLRRALAAYNAGPEAVARHRGIPPYAETQMYVRRVLPLFEGPDVLSAAAVGPGSGSLDRYEAADGTVVYTNLPHRSLPGTTKELLAGTAPREPALALVSRER